jgi:two-component system response regulator FixJ
LVYLVDDDEAVRDSLRLLLDLNGFAVKDYSSVADFWQAFERPDRGCLVLDQHLPVQSGLDFLASADGRALGIPVIMLTGHGDDTLRARARCAGVAAFLDKPVDVAKLIAEIGRALDSASPAPAPSVDVLAKHG